MMKYQSCPVAKLEHIVLATDGSEYSRGAVREALEIAKVCSSKLYIVSVVETNPEFSAYAPELVEKAAKETREYLQSAQKKAEDEGVDCETIPHHGGEVEDHIIDEAEKVKAALIVMGRRGRSGIRRLMMGSITGLVVGRAPCDVLVVPRHAPVTCKKILVATDGSEEGEKAVREAMGLAKRCGSSLIGISVARKEGEGGDARKNVQHVKDVADKEGIEIETVTAIGSPYENIVHTARDKGADLIVVGRKGESAIKKLLMGSVTERVIGLAHCAIMVVH